jgi:CPA1 family monovalent cation:H+ antiporter
MIAGLLLAVCLGPLWRRLGHLASPALVLTGAVLGAAGGLPPHLLEGRLLFEGLLPPLILEAALSLPWRALRRDLIPVLLLAGPGVLLSTLVIGAGAHAAFGAPWAAALLLGALVSATDPVAVLAVFRALHLEGRLRLLIEAESLFNDATVATLFLILCALAAPVLPSPALAVNSPTAMMDLAGIAELAGGTVAAALGGGLMGAAGVQLWRRLPRPWLRLPLALGLAYGGFALARAVDGSGVLTTVVAGLWIQAHSAPSSGGRGELDLAIPALASFAQAINDLIFLLLGSVLLEVGWVAGGGQLLLQAAGIIALTWLGRALAVYPMLATLHDRPAAVPLAWQHVLVWGGLRGALPLALAFDLPVALPGRPLLLHGTLAVVACSVFVQGTTVAWLLRRIRAA